MFEDRDRDILIRHLLIRLRRLERRLDSLIVCLITTLFMTAVVWLNVILLRYH